ncbi:MAG TPA: PEGA domain-containing protein [Vicinamibacterales bacterium]|nr:PEGA domain-containing protein [Vicinamibacterales bacterium]
MGDGRFGPLFLAHDAAGLSVVVRTFAQPFSHSERQRVAYALGALCKTSLEHPAIATPITSGEQDGHLYLVHTYLRGTSLADYVETSGHPPLSDVMVRITHLAGALDFAAAAGVLHGALSARDIIFSPDSAGVSGFGLVQALEAASVPGFHARREDDLRAFAEITCELAGIDVPGPFSSALEFAKALQATLAAPPESSAGSFRTLEQPSAASEDVWPSEPTESGPHIVEPETAFPSEHDAAGGLDIPLRPEAPAAAFRDEPTLPLPSLPPTMFGAAAAAVPQRSRGWLLVPAFFLIVAAGVLLGFTSGFFAREPSAPQAANTASGTEPEATSGRAYTDAPVEESRSPATPPTNPSEPTQSVPTQSVPTPVAPPQAAASTPSAPSPASPAGPAPAPPALTQPAPTPPAPAPSAPIQTPTSATPAPARVAPPAVPPAERRAAPSRTAVTEPPHTGPAAMRVESNPMGAQVFIDGKPVGYTPLVVGDLTPGTHSVRMQIPGYRSWVNAVTLGPGARERVAASLEQQQ